MSSSDRALGSALRRGLRFLGWLLLGAALYGAFFAAFFAFGIEGTIGRRGDELRRQVWELERRVRAAEATEARRAEFDTAVEEVAGELERLAHVLPREAQLGTLEARIVDAAADRRVRIAGFAAGPPEERDFYVRIPLEVDAHGAFAGLSDFVADLGQLERLLVLRGLRLERDGSSFSARLRLDAYHDSPPAEG